MPDDQESPQNPTEQDAGGDQPPVESEAEQTPEPTGQAQAPDQADELAASALASAQAAISALGDSGEPESAEVAQTQAPAPVDLPDFQVVNVGEIPKGIDLLSDVNVDVTIELGRTQMLVEDVLRLAEGAVVELDKLAGDPVDIYVNQRLVARGEVLVLNDNFCIRVNDILDADLVEQDA